MSVPGWTMSRHAQKRRKEMKITEHTIADTLENPRVDYTSNTSEYGDGARIAKKHGIAVAYDTLTRTIITVLWDTTQEYTRPS